MQEAESHPLTFRNITSTPTNLILVERYNEHPGGRSGVLKSTQKLFSFKKHDWKSSASHLAAHSQSFNQNSLSIPLEPFRTFKSNIEPPDLSSNQILRLTFETEGERYRVEIPCLGSQSTTLTPLTPNPHFQYTAVYILQHAHLTLFSSANLQCWMRNLKDETPLSALSIPGTHNSPTYRRALPSVRCQAVRSQTQLENGVRFFDIRVQVEKPHEPAHDGLILVHSVFSVSLKGTKYFRDLVNEVHAFLERNPSEIVIMSVKREGIGNGTDAHLSRVLRDHYAGDINRWFTAPRVPTLGEARGKIVLMRRFSLEDSLKDEWNGAGWCIDAEVWVDNTSNDTCPSGDVCVQDFYQVLEAENIEKKITFCQEHLERAARRVCIMPDLAIQDETSMLRQPLYLNFLSASNFWKTGCWPEKVAAKLNPSIVDFLCRRHHEGQGAKDLGEHHEKKLVGDGSTGIVVCDWVGNAGNWDLVRCIVGMNTILELREKLDGKS
ncbi:hypothetical protein MMC20_004431 [Loxospora ochrophaea]|nr:hypothetical protein [Loxospora ochrophaea]